MQVYIDDIVIKSALGNGHLDHLQHSFKMMRKYKLKMNPLKCAFCVQVRYFLGLVIHKKGIEINQNKMKDIRETKPPLTKKELQSLLGKINFLRRFILNLSGKIRAFSSLFRLKKENFIWQPEHQRVLEKIKEYLMNPLILSPPVRNRWIRLYISASCLTMGSMLEEEDDNGVERAIYYLIRALNDVETRYSIIDAFVCNFHV